MVVALKPLHEAFADQARRGLDLPGRLRDRQEGDGRTVQPDPGDDQRPARSQRDGLPAPDRLQLPAADRRLPRQRLHQGRDEDGERDAARSWRTTTIRVTATTVRVPVFYGHSESVNIETERKLTAAKRSASCWQSAPGVKVVDDPARTRYPMPIEAAGQDRHARRPHPRGRVGGERPEPLDRGRQHPQGGGHQRRADCGDPCGCVSISLSLTAYTCDHPPGGWLRLSPSQGPGPSVTGA